MSADRWGVCPKCGQKKEEERLKRINTATDAYGKVTPAEYLALVEKANAPIAVEETMREDYEIWTDAEGTFTVDYSCSCSKCGFAFKFNEQRDVLQMAGGS